MKVFAALALAFVLCFSSMAFAEREETLSYELTEGYYVGVGKDIKPGWYAATPVCDGKYCKLSIFDYNNLEQPVHVASYAWFPTGESLLADKDAEVYTFPLWDGCVVISNYHSGFEVIGGPLEHKCSWQKYDETGAVRIEFVAPLADSSVHPLVPETMKGNNSESPASSADESEKEILFRGIPWFTPINEAAEMLGLDGKLYEDEKLYSWGPDYLKVSAQNAGFKYSVSGIGNTFFVAGYSVSEVYLYALYGHTEDTINRNADASKLDKASYFFDIDGDGTDVYDDLFAKLCRLYGSPSEVLEEADEEYAVWHGSNESSVILEKSRLYSYKDSVSLSYGRTDSDSLIADFKAAAMKENQLNSENAYDGL